MHDRKGDGVAKFWLEPVDLFKSSGFRPSELREIREIIEETMSNSSNNGTATLADDDVRAIDLKFTKDSLITYLEDGRSIEVPLEWYPRLAHASASKRNNYEWIGRGLGISWPELDEDLSVEGFLKGYRAPRTGAYMDFPWRKDSKRENPNRKKSIPSTLSVRPRKKV